MIECKNVSKCYLGGHEALTQINFSLKSGEMAFLTGHSGAGKSTLLRLICFMERSSRGKVIVNNTDLTALKWHEAPLFRRNIGIVFQTPDLLTDETIFDNVALPLVIAGMGQAEVGRRVRASLEQVGLLSKERMYPTMLSIGEQQRVGIARAIVNKPAILIADEPTGNLDPQLSSDIMRLFAQLNQVGVTVLIATHDVSLISSMEYRILTLKEGRLQ